MGNFNTHIKEECPAMRLRSVARISALGLLLNGSFALAAPPEIPPPRIGGYIQVREAWVEPTGLTATIHRARLSADGALPRDFSYRALVELESGATGRTAGSVSLREAYVRWSRSDIALQAGQFKTPFSAEYLVPVPALEVADLSAVVDSLAPKYDIGAMGEWSGAGLGFWLGVFNGEGQNAGLNRDSTVLLVARVQLRPLAGTMLAGSLARSGPDSLRYGGDVAWERGRGLLRAEWLGQWSRFRDRDDFGWSLLGGYRATPWLQLVARQDDFERPSIGESRRVTATYAGCNVEVPESPVRLIVNYLSRSTGSPRARRNGVIGQAQVRF